MNQDSGVMIFGQRISPETNLDALDSQFTDWLLVELLIGNHFPENALQIIASLKQKKIVNEVIPVFILDFLAPSHELADVLKKCATFASECGYPKIVLAVDEDGEAIRFLSPRNDNENKRNLVLEEIAKAVSFFASSNLECLVALTVEELCPGGIDPTMGIEIAKKMIDSGAKGIIASGGTEDFPYLKYRRKTKMKSHEEDKSDSWPEMWLSSACWLVSRLNVPVYAQGFIANPVASLIEAKRLGLSGIISVVSVNHPSSK